MILSGSDFVLYMILSFFQKCKYIYTYIHIYIYIYIYIALGREEGDFSPISKSANKLTSVLVKEVSSA